MIVVGILMGIIAFILPIAIIVLIVSAINKKSKESKSSFEDSIRNIYIYFILIITLIAIIIGVIATFRVGLDVLLPEESLYESSYSNSTRQKNENIIELFTTLSLVISVTPIFRHHNNLAKQSRANKSSETNKL